MKLKDKAAWELSVNRNQDPYGKATMDYAKRWAELMEKEFALGVSLESCAKETSQRADTDGITGFMYGCAVQQLAQCWEYGEDLRRWHNLREQVGSEGEAANERGGVLNPALFNINFQEGEKRKEDR